MEKSNLNYALLAIGAYHDTSQIPSRVIPTARNISMNQIKSPLIVRECEDWPACALSLTLIKRFPH